MELLDYTYGFHTGVSDQVLLLLHGVGGDENDMEQVGKLLAPDASQLRPKGKVMVDGQARYFTRQADASFNPLEVERETTDLVTFIDEARTQHYLSGSQLVAIGYSNGANMIASLLAKHPGLVKKAILFRGMLPITFSEHPDLHGVDVLLVNGIDDPIMDRVRVARLNTFLTEHGATVKLHWSAANHQLTSEDIAIATQWLTR